MKVLTLGTFDIPHMGHAIFLKRCAALGDLTVGLNSDPFVEKFKGSSPIFSWAERCRLLQRMGYEVRMNDSSGADLILRIRPDLLVVGADWTPKTYYDQIDFQQWEMDDMNITLLFMGYQSIISTTKIKERLDRPTPVVV